MTQQTAIKLPMTIIGGNTHPGVVKKKNDDAYKIFDIHREDNQTIHVVAVADGVSTTYGGEKASQIAVETIEQVLSYPSKDFSRLPFAKQLIESIKQANADIQLYARQDEAIQRMSTTLVIAALFGNRLYVTHLGDSRAYLVRDKKIYQLTRDHTWVQEALDNNLISPEEAKEHPNRSVIQKYLGGTNSDPDPFPGVFPPGKTVLDDYLQVHPGDMILLCSDGINSSLSDEEIKTIMLDHRGDPEQSSKALIERAIALKERDNITAAIIDIPKEEPYAQTETVMQADDRFTSDRSWSRLRNITLLLTTILSLMAVIFAADLFLNLDLVNRFRDILSGDPNTQEFASTPYSSVSSTQSASPAISFRPVSSPTFLPKEQQAVLTSPTPPLKPTSPITNTPTIIPFSTAMSNPIAMNTKSPTGTNILIGTLSVGRRETPELIYRISSQTDLLDKTLALSSTPMNTTTFTPTEMPTATPTMTTMPTITPTATSTPTKAATSTPRPTVTPTMTPTMTPLSMLTLTVLQDGNRYIIYTDRDIANMTLSCGDCIELVAATKLGEAESGPIGGLGKCEKNLTFSENELHVGINYIALWEYATVDSFKATCQQPFESGAFIQRVSNVVEINKGSNNKKPESSSQSQSGSPIKE